MLEAEGSKVDSSVPVVFDVLVVREEPGSAVTKTVRVTLSVTVTAEGPAEVVAVDDELVNELVGMTVLEAFGAIVIVIY